MSDEEKKAIVELKHFSNMTAYWKQEEYTNSEIDNYIKIVLNLIEKKSKEIERKNEILIWKQKHEEQLQKEIEELKQEKEYLNCIVESDEDNYINKDKIKAEIEERNKWLQEYDEQEEMNELQKDDYRLIKVERNILQSLLEKE